MTLKISRWFSSLVILTFFSTAVNAQNSLVFCLGTDSLGNPVDSGDAFAIPREGADVSLLITLNEPVNTDTVQIDVYKKQPGFKDKYLTTFNILTGKDYTSFITDYTFTREGLYYFYVYGDQKRQLAFGQVTIEYIKKF